MSKPFNGVLPINESNTDKDEYFRLYMIRKKECRQYLKQAKSQYARILDDGRASKVVTRTMQHHNNEGVDLWVDTVDNNGEVDDFFDFLQG